MPTKKELIVQISKNPKINKSKFIAWCNSERLKLPRSSNWNRIINEVMKSNKITKDKLTSWALTNKPPRKARRLKHRRVTEILKKLDKIWNQDTLNLYPVPKRNAERVLENIAWCILQSHMSKFKRYKWLKQYQIEPIKHGIKKYRPDIAIADKRLAIELKVLQNKNQPMEAYTQTRVYRDGGYDNVLIIMYDAGKHYINKDIILDPEEFLRTIGRQYEKEHIYTRIIQHRRE